MPHRRAAYVLTVYRPLAEVNVVRAEFDTLHAAVTAGNMVLAMYEVDHTLPPDCVRVRQARFAFTTSMKDLTVEIERRS